MRRLWVLLLALAGCTGEPAAASNPSGVTDAQPLCAEFVDADGSMKPYRNPLDGGERRVPYYAPEPRTAPRDCRDPWWMGPDPDTLPCIMPEPGEPVPDCMLPD